MPFLQHRFSALVASALLATACSPAPGPSAPSAAATGVEPPATASPAPSASGEPATTSDPAEIPTTAPTAVPAAPSPAHADITTSLSDARLAPGAALLEAGENKRARVALTKVVPEIDASGTLEAQLVAHALLGRACQLSGDGKCAAAHHKTVRELWKDPSAAKDKLDAQGGDDAAKVRRLGRALNAVGEALFFAAEEKRAAAEKEAFPAYKGSGTKDSVLKHVNAKVAPWVKARRARIDEAEKAYLAILSLQPVPPPRWVVSAASRVGHMWGTFADSFRAAPIPTEWTQQGMSPHGVPWEEIRKAYQEAIDGVVAPLLASARGAYKKCAEMSAKYGYADALSRECDDWLAKNPAPASP